jgi:hypothetical protein
MGRTPEVPDHTHGRVEGAILAHIGLRPEQWSLYQLGGHEEAVWEATALYGNAGGRMRGCIFATLREDENAARTFYLNSGEQPLVEDGRTFWQWHDAMDPDAKETAAVLSEPEMNILLQLLHIGRCHTDGVPKVWDKERIIPVLRVIRGTEPRLDQVKAEEEKDATVTSLLGRLAKRGSAWNGRDKPDA